MLDTAIKRADELHEQRGQPPLLRRLSPRKGRQYDSAGALIGSGNPRWRRQAVGRVLAPYVAGRAKFKVSKVEAWLDLHDYIKWSGEGSP